MKKISKVLIPVLMFMVLFAPVVSFSAGLVPCKDNCGWNELMTLVNTVVNYILFFLVIPIAAIMFAAAGIMLLTSGGDPSKKTKAKDLFLGVVLGLVIAAAAWLIVHTVSSILGYTGAGFFGF
jgi:hypothetical protein